MDIKVLWGTHMIYNDSPNLIPTFSCLTTAGVGRGGRRGGAFFKNGIVNCRGLLSDSAEVGCVRSVGGRGVWRRGRGE